ncbi:ABC transporter ATP-binding protein [Candidimonas nitroreducens]|uniref:ABC transporter ATP-binding protein n=1 Tax=Candidimonas nitroreducens TaxID=683354 RepID=A0A225M4S5_9BURK|nr:ABC transporter ATP-binding protein [Candidimonas nitroreducens]OWT56126.1 ABC transporter ATP-binding protein [Candidimonas nitroreducens]
MLEVDGLHAGYGAADVLHSLRLQVRKGQVACLLGANGAGKSTTMRCLSGLLRPSQGSIRYEGEALQALPAEQIVARGIVLVPEGRRVFAPLTVRENLEMGGYRFLRARRSGEFRRSMERVLEFFPRLAERARQVAGTLSGGEQQMLAIGRALMSDPRVLMLDEPSMGLAPLVVKDIFAAIGRLRQDGLTMLIAEQNAGLALQAADYGYVLQEGTVAYDGSAETLRGDTRVQSAYLGV